jgi:hypothetical protein
MWRKIQGWKENILPRTGKEILVKAVAQAIPVFAMSCFDITKTFCDDIISMVCHYWWKNQEERHTRCSILKGFALLKEGLVWRVGDGANIMALDDPWIPAGDIHRPRTRFAAGPTLQRWMISNIGGWDEKLVQNQFLPEDANAILSIRSVIGWRIILLGTLTQKKHFWRNQPTIWGPVEGQKKQGRQVECSSKNTGDSVVKLNWNKIWDLQAPNKLKCLFGALHIISWQVE